MSYNLFLDDVREPKNCFDYTAASFFIDLDWVVVRSYEEFVNHIKKNGLPGFISFDHDLGFEHYQHANSGEIPYDQYREKTGFDCANWLVGYCRENNKKLPPYFVHSMNPVGSKNIRNLLNKHLYF